MEKEKRRTVETRSAIKISRQTLETPIFKYGVPFPLYPKPLPPLFHKIYLSIPISKYSKKIYYYVSHKIFQNQLMELPI
jgi:hypothetical protein